VSLEVPEGSTLGLLGPNGSGKTTLLKLIAGILRPTEGRIVTRGRIAALLALGAGFHPELTGRENVYLDGALLGVSRARMDTMFGGIIEFAELQDFIDNQIKFYSAGMQVRLGFAVAVNADPAILLVDEVLAVGDLAFQRKCLDRVGQLQREGRTIIFVTHAPDLAVRVCDRVVLLDRGRIRAEGPPAGVVREFRSLMSPEAPSEGAEFGTRQIEITKVQLLRADGSSHPFLSPGEDMMVVIELQAKGRVDDPIVWISIFDQESRLVYRSDTARCDVRVPVMFGRWRIHFVLHSLPFVNGRYEIRAGVRSPDGQIAYHTQERRYPFDVVRGEENPGQVFIPVECRVRAL
jgi:ABC-2 type transport system ATP-binding protein